MATHTMTTATYIFKNVIFRWKFPMETICVPNRRKNSRFLSDTSQENFLTDELCDEHVPLTPENSKTVKVAVIGVPNVGKSTIINNLTGRMVCPISRKVHTTRLKVRAAAVEGNTQVVFLDTPGLVSAEEIKRFKLERQFSCDGEQAMAEADVIGVVHDASNHWTRDRLDAKVLRLLHIYADKDSFLVVNKVDTLKSKRKLLDVVRKVTTDKMATRRNAGGHKKQQLTENELLSIVRDKHGWPNFREVFLVSALTGSGMDGIKAYLLRQARPGAWVLPADQVTDQRPEQVVEATVRARLLDHLPQELPYIVRTTLTYLQTNDHGHVVAVVVVECPSSRLEKLVLGRKGERVRVIAREAELDLFSAFKTPVFLKLVVESKDKTP